jgi:hypothetical protein
MTDGARERKSKSGPSPEKTRSGIEADCDQATEACAEQGHYIEEEPRNLIALCLGALVVLILVLGALFIVNQTRCNPLFSDAGLSRSQACR